MNFLFLFLQKIRQPVLFSCQLITFNSNSIPTLLKGGQDLPKIGSLGFLVQTFLLENGDKPEKGGLPLLLLLYSSITFTLYFGKVKFPLLLQDSHPSLYSTNTQKTTQTNFFDYQCKVFLNIEKVLVKISEEQP